MESTGALRPEHRSLAFLLQQAAERSYRLEAFLQDVEYHSTKSDASLIEALASRLKKTQQILDDPLVALQSLSTSGELLTPRRFQIYLDSVRNFNVQYKLLHFQFRLLVPIPPIEPEVYILLDDVIDWMKVDWTVVYYYYFNFGELDLDDYFRDVPAGTPTSTKAVLLLPYATRNDPLMWVNLVHEVAHVCEKQHAVSDTLLDGVTGEASELALTRRWSIEYFADHLSIKLLGPAYAAAFISWVLTHNAVQLRPSPTHPSPLRRIAAMKRFLTRLELLTVSAATLFEIVEKTAGVTLDSENFDEPYISQSGDTLSRPVISEDDIQSRVADYVMTRDDVVPRRLSPDDLARTAEAIRDFNNGLPISSSRTSTQNQVTSALEALEEKADARPQDFYQVAAMLREEPNRTKVILNVGWQHRITTLLDQFLAIFSVDGQLAEKHDAYKRRMLNADVKLQRSIELAYIHLKWIAADESTRDSP